MYAVAVSFSKSTLFVHSNIYIALILSVVMRYNVNISDSSFTNFGSIPYSISATTSEVGEDIYVLGYPLTATMGDEIKLTTGVSEEKII